MPNPQQPTVRDLLLNTGPGTALGALAQVGVPQPSKAGQSIAPPNQDFLNSIVNFLKTAVPQQPSPYEKNLAGLSPRVRAMVDPTATVSTTQPTSPQTGLVRSGGTGGNLTPGLSTTPPISTTRVSPVTTFSASTPSERQTDWSSATSFLPPVNLTDTPTVGLGNSPNKLWVPTENENLQLAGKRQAMNTDQVLAGLAAAKDPINFSRVLGGPSGATIPTSQGPGYNPIDDPAAALDWLKKQGTQGKQ